MKESISQKQCSVCKQTKPASAFPINGTLKCLACKRDEYRKHHPVPVVYHADLENGTKICRLCGETKDLKEFYADKNMHDGYSARCKTCKYIRVAKESAPEGMKRCAACKGVFPANTENFYSNDGASDGLCSYCKKCSFPQKRVKNIRNGYKICSMCKRELPATKEYFYARNDRKEGKLQPRCKKCAGSYRMTEKYREYIRMYNKNNRDRKRLYWQENGDKFRAYQRQYYATHRELYKRYRNSKSYIEQKRSHERKRRALKKGVGGSHTPKDIQRQLKAQKHKCYYCFSKLGRGKGAYHIDHIVPLTRDGSSNGPHNLVIACPRCNLSKGNKLLHEWPKGGRLL